MLDLFNTRKVSGYKKHQLFTHTHIAILHSFDGDTNFFSIVARDFQGDTLAPYLFIIYLDYILRMSIDLIKENGFTLKKKKRQERDDISQKL